MFALDVLFNFFVLQIKKIWLKYKNISNTAMESFEVPY